MSNTFKVRKYKNVYYFLTMCLSQLAREKREEIKLEKTKVPLPEDDMINYFK